MSRAAIAVEGFIAKELTVREVTGHRVLDVDVPVTPQKKVNDRWEDSGDTVWYRATFWDEHADEVLQSVEKGDLVTLTGGLEVNSWESNGKTGTNLVVTFPVLAKIVRRPKRGSGNQSVPPASEIPDSWNEVDESSVPF